MPAPCNGKLLLDLIRRSLFIYREKKKPHA